MDICSQWLSCFGTPHVWLVLFIPVVHKMAEGQVSFDELACFGSNVVPAPEKQKKSDEVAPPSAAAMEGQEGQ